MELREFGGWEEMTAKLVVEESGFQIPGATSNETFYMEREEPSECHETTKSAQKNGTETKSGCGKRGVMSLNQKQDGKKGCKKSGRITRSKKLIKPYPEHSSSVDPVIRDPEDVDVEGKKKKQGSGPERGDKHFPSTGQRCQP